MRKSGWTLPARRPHFPGMRTPASPLLLLVVAWLPAAIAQVPAVAPWRELLLDRTEIADTDNALVRWRPALTTLFPEDPALSSQLAELSSPLADPPAAADPLNAWLSALTPTLSALVLRQGEGWQFPPLRGPETELPDHQPLRQLALVRVVAMKIAWLSGHRDEALSFATDNLALSRTLLRAQEGLLPLIAASGVWQLSLDGVYWLTRQPGLTAAQAGRLQLELLRDDHLATEALTRGFRGEFTFFTRIVVDRLPPTRDVDLLLSGIGSLGMAPPEPPAEGELHLDPPARDPLDREATLQAAADDVRGWIAALSAQSRHPRGLTERHTRMHLLDNARKIPELLRYASQDTPATPGQIKAVDAEIASVDNPVGKLFLIITTSNWESVCASVFRREAQRGALTGLLAWRRFGRPASWKELVAAGLLAEPPADPFSSGPLRLELKPARIWSAGLDGVDDGGQGNGENEGLPPDLTWPARPDSPMADGK